MVIPCFPQVVRRIFQLRFIINESVLQAVFNHLAKNGLQLFWAECEFFRDWSQCPEGYGITGCIFETEFTPESVNVLDKAAIIYAFLHTWQGENNRINIIYFIMISVYTSRVHKKRPFHQANCLKVKEREL